MVDLAERGVVGGAGGVFDLRDLTGPELGLDAAETAKLPIGADEGVGEKGFERVGRLPLLVIVGGELFELSRVFTRNDVSRGVDAGFEGIETGNGLPLRGARAGGFLRIATIRLDLQLRGHIDLRLQANGATREMGLAELEVVEEPGNGVGENL